MKMKKLLTVLLALVIATSMTAFVACNKKGDDPASTDNQKPSGDDPSVVKYTVTFVVDGETYKTVQVERNATVSAPETDPEKEGYTFVGWGGYRETMKIKKDYTFTAQFEKAMNGLPVETVFQTAGSAKNGDHQVDVYEATKRTETIEIDGVLDDSYLDATPIAIVETAEGSNQANGFAYVMWDASYLYVFVVVNDTSVATYGTGDRWLSDSVEIVLDTYNKASSKTQNYGDSYRGGEYIGEGQFRINAGEQSIASGLHWMWDANVEREGASRIVDGEGYTAEFKIGWGSFTAKANSQIAIAMLINNGANHERTGVVGLEAAQIDAFQWAGVLSKLNLVD